LLSLFTHIHAFWVAALIIALIEFPSFSLPDVSKSLGRIAGSLERIAGDEAKSAELKPLPPTGPQAAGRKSLPSTQSKADGPSSATHANEPALKEGGRHA
jgi:hypothetical protein